MHVVSKMARKGGGGWRCHTCQVRRVVLVLANSRELWHARTQRPCDAILGDTETLAKLFLPHKTSTVFCGCTCVCELARKSLSKVARRDITSTPGGRSRHIFRHTPQPFHSARPNQAQVLRRRFLRALRHRLAWEQRCLHRACCLLAPVLASTQGGARAVRAKLNPSHRCIKNRTPRRSKL